MDFPSLLKRYSLKVLQYTTEDDAKKMGVELRDVLTLNPHPYAKEFNELIRLHVKVDHL